MVLNNRHRNNKLYVTPASLGYVRLSKAREPGPSDCNTMHKA